MVSFVDEIISTKNDISKSDSEALELQLEKLVYKLYDLTYQEVKVIEPYIEQRLIEAEYNQISLD